MVLLDAWVKSSTPTDPALQLAEKSEPFLGLRRHPSGVASRRDVRALARLAGVSRAFARSRRGDRSIAVLGVDARAGRA